MTTAVTEKQRQQYLQAMGLQPWFARYRLPAAPLAGLCAWPEPLQPSPALQAPAVEPAPSSRGEMLGSLKAALTSAEQALAEGRSGPPIVSPSSPVPHDDSAAQACEAAAPAVDLAPAAEVLALPAAAENSGVLPRVRLFAAPLPGAGLVVGELPVHGEPFSRFHLQLLTDLLRAGRRLPEEPFALKHFQWPVCEALVAPYGRRGAVEALQGFLRNQLAYDACRWLLLLGPQALNLVLDQADAFEPHRGMTKIDGRTCVITHGLNQLMRLPELKREAWQDLRGLLELPHD